MLHRRSVTAAAARRAAAALGVRLGPGAFVGHGPDGSVRCCPLLAIAAMGNATLRRIATMPRPDDAELTELDFADLAAMDPVAVLGFVAGCDARDDLVVAPGDRRAFQAWRQCGRRMRRDLRF